MTAVNIQPNKVLVCSLVKDSAKWLERFLGYIGGFTYPEPSLEYAIVDCGSSDNSYDILTAWQKKYSGKCEIRIEHVEEETIQTSRFITLARMRNYLVSKYLTDHEYVLMLDSDIVSGPKNLVELLINSRPEIIAPLVFIENHPLGDVFYDRLAFRDATGKKFQHNFPYSSFLGQTKITDVNSVGTCYLVNSEIYRRGVSYYPDTEHGEQVEFCLRARANNFRVQVNPLVRVFHVNFEDYSIPWH